MKKNIATKLILVLLAVLTISTAQAQVCVSSADKSKLKLVKALYQERAAEDNDADSDPSLFYSKGLNRLFDADEQCAAKSQGVCNLDFDWLFDSQDSPSVFNAKFNFSCQANHVTVKIYDKINKYSTTLIFSFASQGKDLRVDDIRYKSGSTLRQILTNPQ